MRWSNVKSFYPVPDLALVYAVFMAASRNLILQSSVGAVDYIY